MVSRPAIVHLIGYPGVGKYTIATALAHAAEGPDARFVVVDNHHTSNVILAVLPVDGVAPLPATVWDRVAEVRHAVIRTIQDLSPPEWSFVFTNVALEDDPSDHAVVEQLARLAGNRHSRYVPVRLTCEIDELLRRVPQPDRRARLKWIDADTVRAFVESRALLTVHHPALLELDVTSISPDEAAARILTHLATVP